MDRKELLVSLSHVRVLGSKSFTQTQAKLALNRQEGELVRCWKDASRAALAGKHILNKSSWFISLKELQSSFHRPLQTVAA